MKRDKVIVEPVTLGKGELCFSCKHLQYLPDNKVMCIINAPRWDALIVPIYLDDRWEGCKEYESKG